MPKRLADALFAVVALAVLGGLALGPAGTRFVGASAPLLAVTLGAADPDVEVLSLGLASSGNRAVLRLRADLARPMRIGGREHRPLRERQGWMQVDVTRGGLLQHAVLLLGVVLAWPAASVRQRLGRAAAALPLAGALYVLTATSTLLGEFWAPVWADLFGSVDPWILDCSQFLMGGGGSMLALVLAAAVVLASTRWGNTGVSVAGGGVIGYPSALTTRP